MRCNFYNWNLVKKENRIIKREMENGDTSSLSFKNCKKREKNAFWPTDFTCQMDCNSTTVENHRFQNVKTLPFIYGRLSSVILKFDCAAQFAHSPKTLHFCIKTFSPAQQKFWGDFISTYVRSLWIKNCTWVKLTKSSLNRHWCFKSSHCY